MRRVRVVVRGDVQNVGFRSWTKHKADHFGAKGWVKNNVDGSVEAVFEGMDSVIEEVLESCRRGPPGSYVRDVEVKDEAVTDKFLDFRIVG
ncbi:MAG: acylphosphatase [Candidatus Aenigmarchaeota archaeon]|nr:acylphosphatase [Candidatus Aenigmarchaeota archaeon]